MFEHLGPVPETKTKSRAYQTKTYISLLVVAVLVFIFSFATSRGPSSAAQEYKAKANINVTVSSQSEKHTYVASGDNFELFNFNIHTDRAGIVLYKIKFAIKGLYDMDTLGDLKLFHQSVQLGDIKQVDSQGSVYFDIENYVLPVGDNYFSLVLPQNISINGGQILELSLSDSSSLFFKYQDSLLTARGDFPVFSGPISFVEQGSLTVSSDVGQVLRVADLPQPFLSLRLKNQAEKLAMTQLAITYTEKEGSLAGNQFALIRDTKVLATGTADDGQIIFDFDAPLTIEKNIELVMHSLGSPVGSYDFALADWRALGSISGKEIPFSETASLAKVQVVPYFPEFKTGQLKNTLSEGWNELYNIKTIAKGSGQLDLYKLTWVLDAYGLKITEAEVWVDDRVYIADVVVSDKQIIVKASWDNPIIINKDATDIKLLIKADNVTRPAKVETYLLTDEKPITEGILTGNILWGYEDKLYNGYLLPHLPLIPNILNN